jgi:trimethylamine--corrinoid protein Co-methyltransferase
MSRFTRCCIANDIPENFDLDVNTAYALLTNTTRLNATTFTLTSRVAIFLTMFDITADAEGASTKTPFLKPHIVPIKTTMRYREDAVDIVCECIAHNIPISRIIAHRQGQPPRQHLLIFLRNHRLKSWPVCGYTILTSVGFGK